MATDDEIKESPEKNISQCPKFPDEGCYNYKSPTGEKTHCYFWLPDEKKCEIENYQ